MLLFIYFNPIVGPDLLYSVPPNAEEILDEQDLNQIKRLMDASGPGFFTHAFSEELLTANLFFMIPSRWARGQQEMVMITKIVEEENPNLSDYKKKLTEFKETLLNKYPGVFKALYIHNPPMNYKDEVDKAFEILKNELEELSKQFTIQDSQTFGKLYDFEMLSRNKLIPIPSTVLQRLQEDLGDKKNYFLVYQKSGEYILRFIPVSCDRILKITILFEGQLTPIALKMLSESFQRIGLPLIFTSGICQEYGTGNCIYEVYFDPGDSTDYDFIRKELEKIPNVIEIRTLDIEMSRF